MSYFKRAVDLLASWRLSVVLMVLGALFYALLTIWATSSPPHVVGLIGEMLPFKALYALLLLNTGFCLWRRIPSLAAGISSAPQLSRAPARWELARNGEDIAGARAFLKSEGYKLSEGGGGLWGLRHRWGPLGTFFFHGALFLVAAGFLATSIWRSEVKTWVAVGEVYEGRPDQMLPGSGEDDKERVIPVLPPFEVMEIEPAFWRDLLLFTELRARLAFPGGGERTTRINSPLMVGWSTFMRLSGFGYALAYSLHGPDGRPLDAAVARLNLFPPGRRDMLTLQGLPHRVYVMVIPDTAMVGGAPVNRSPNLANPRIAARIYRGRVDLGSALLRPGEAVSFEGFTLRFDEIRYWGEFSAVKDPGAPIIFAGFALGLAGLALKMRGRRSEVTWEPGPDGGVMRGWGGAKLPLVAGEVGA